MFVCVVDESGKYSIGYNLGKNCLKTNIVEFAPKILRIPQRKVEEFLKDNGAFKHLDGRLYFHKESDVKNVIEHLNKIKKTD